MTGEKLQTDRENQRYMEYLQKQNFINLGIVVNNNGEVLMIKRKVPEEGRGDKVLIWVFPGGRQEFDTESNQPKETRSECVHREVLLETGYDVASVSEINLKFHPDIPGVAIVYHKCKLNTPEPISLPQESDEVEEVKWVKPSEIRNLITTTLDEKVAKELGI